MGKQAKRTTRLISVFYCDQGERLVTLVLWSLLTPANRIQQEDIIPAPAAHAWEEKARGKLSFTSADCLHCKNTTSTFVLHTFSLKNTWRGLLLFFRNGFNQFNARKRRLPTIRSYVLLTQSFLGLDAYCHYGQKPSDYREQRRFLDVRNKYRKNLHTDRSDKRAIQGICQKGKSSCYPFGLVQSRSCFL
jgi:hypothetical protein